MRFPLFLCFLSIISISLLGQNFSFRVPVDIPVLLNGNFGEIRANHFHAGIDIKTNGSTGIPVHAIDDGIVSRVSVSATGYGHAVYIDHPSGFTSVYGHLERFAPHIETYVKQQQYNQQSFDVNLEPDQNAFRFKRGDIIGYSGNTGGSAGPHLHFEIRKTDSQHPVNPLRMGFDVADDAKPVARNIFFYQLTDSSHVNRSPARYSTPLVLKNGVYRLKDVVEPVPLWGEIGFGIDAMDYLTGSWSKCGIYKLELWVDSLMMNSFVLDELAYEKMRYLNCHVDYEASIVQKQLIHKTYVEPGDKLDIYSNTINRGICHFTDGKKHRVKIVFYDAKMNRSEAQFDVLSTSPVLFKYKPYAAYFRYGHKNRFENDEVVLSFPEDVLYSDLKFEYNQLPKLPGTFSSLHWIHDSTVPLHHDVEVKIKAEKLPEELRDKALICLVDGQGKTIKSLGGSFLFGWVKTETRTLGNMCVEVDTLAPKIRPLSFTKENTLAESGRLRFKITDDLSGIQSYNGYIDGNWVLFEYDAKTNTIAYRFDEHITKGRKHSLKVQVKDVKENLREYNNIFYY